MLVQRDDIRQLETASGLQLLQFFVGDLVLCL